MPGKITVIMPVFNEEKTLRKTLSQLSLSHNEELIVVDGGSSDNSLSIAREFTDKAYKTRTGRASVMNFGVTKAEGEILLFLHADCILPDMAFDIIRKTLDNSEIAAGSFDLRIDNSKFRFRVIELGANLRSRAFSIPYGDQGIFLREKDFKRIGGYAEIPLMEDIEISRRLKKTGKIVFVRPPVIVSARRWIKEGALYTTLRDWMNAFSYLFLRVSPENLKKHYRDIR